MLNGQTESAAKTVDPPNTTTKAGYLAIEAGGCAPPIYAAPKPVPPKRPNGQWAKRPDSPLANLDPHETLIAYLNGLTAQNLADRHGVHVSAICHRMRKEFGDGWRVARSTKSLTVIERARMRVLEARASGDRLELKRARAALYVAKWRSERVLHKVISESVAGYKPRRRKAAPTLPTETAATQQKDA